MSETVQWVIIGVIMVAALAATIISRRRHKDESCGGCSLKEICTKSKGDCREGKP